MDIVIVTIISYLLGSIPFGYLITRQRHIDIRKIGSGNIGATNTYRALGLTYALLVGILDFFKGLIPTFIASHLWDKQEAIAIVAFAAFLGHLFPLYLKFKGGKGVATFAGTLVIIIGVKLFLLIFIVWLFFLYTTKIMSLTNLIVSALIPFIFLIITHSIVYFWYSIIVGILIWWAHRKNIQQLRKGTEKKLTK